MINLSDRQWRRVEDFMMRVVTFEIFLVVNVVVGWLLAEAFTGGK